MKNLVSQNLNRKDVKNMLRIDELTYKLTAIIEYLQNYGGYNYEVYNHLCPSEDNEPDSNIVEYAEDVLDIVQELLECMLPF